MRPRTALALSVCFALLGSVCIDRVVFDWAIFRVPNHSGWDDFRWYNFQYQTAHLIHKYAGRQTQDAAGSRRAKPLVLIVGSSIAQYSAQKDILERELQRLGQSADVELLVHASMLPLDLRHYAPAVKRIAPDVILYITNPADLELERYLPPWEAGPVYDNAAEAAYMGIRHPMLLFYPGAYAWEEKGLSVERRLGLAFRALFGGLRMRYEWLDPIMFSYRAGSAPAKSYLNYQGVEIVGGLWREGLSGACFEIPSDLARTVFQVPQNLMVGGRFSISVYDAERVRIDHGTCTEPRTNALFKITPAKPGWQELFRTARSLPVRIHVRLSQVAALDGTTTAVSGSVPATLGRGIRFPGNFGLTVPREDDFYVRRRSLEDQRISALSAAAYARDLDRRIQPDDWRKPEHIAMRQLNTLRLAKYYTRWAAFTEIPQAAELKRFTNEVRPSRVVIVNNPEHPETLSEYKGTAWYSGYLAYMAGLSADPRVSFVDMSGRGDGVRFSDAHHLTYDGMLRMAPLYAKVLADAIVRTK